MKKNNLEKFLMVTYFKIVFSSLLTLHSVCCFNSHTYQRKNVTSGLWKPLGKGRWKENTSVCEYRNYFKELQTDWCYLLMIQTEIHEERF